MNYGGHKIGGITTSAIIMGIVLYHTQSFITTIICGITTFIFALYPDMDIHSTPRKIFIPIGSIAMLTLFFLDYKVQGAILFSLVFIPITHKHRGLFHSILGMLIVSFAWNYMVNSLLPIDDLYGYLYGASAVAGYLTHLSLDTHFKLV